LLASNKAIALNATASKQLFCCFVSFFFKAIALKAAASKQLL
jgi:hypothetical protein